MIHALTMILMSADAQRRNKDMDDFRDDPFLYPNLPLPAHTNKGNSNSRNRKLWKRTRKNCDRMLSVALHNRWLLAGVWQRNNSVLFKEKATESLTMVQWVYI